MKKALVITIIVIMYFFIYFLHVNFFSWFTIAGVMPNLFVLLILFTGLFINSKVGSIVGFALGLYTDFLFGNKIGINAILFLIVGFSGGFLDKKFSKDSRMTLLIVSTSVTAIYELLFYSYNNMVFSASTNISAFLFTLLIELLYNALLIIIFYPLIHKYGCRAENAFENKDVLLRYF